MIIDENQLSSAHNILNITTFKTTNKQPPPHNNRQKRLLLKASSYLSIGHLRRIPRLFSSENETENCDPPREEREWHPTTNQTAVMGGYTLSPPGGSQFLASFFEGNCDQVRGWGRNQLEIFSKFLYVFYFLPGIEWSIFFVGYLQSSYFWFYYSPFFYYDYDYF